MENLTDSPQLLELSQGTLNWILQVDITEMSWTRLLAQSLHTNSHRFVPPGVVPCHPLTESSGQQQGGGFWEATGFAVCFQNHIDYNKLYIKHCLVLSWGHAHGGGAEFTRTRPSLA